MALWVLLPVLLGFVPGTLKPDHGSIIWVVSGVYASVAGVVVNAVTLLLGSGKRRARWWILWGAVAVISLTIGWIIFSVDHSARWERWYFELFAPFTFVVSGK
jgi:hypothetical protein